jgi:3-dehydroquinate dehydratase/shikimate dehydrogenase
MNRTHSHAALLASQFGGSVIEDPAQIPIKLIINTTPLGMSPTIEQTPLPNYVFNSDQIVFDLIYTPRETRLLREAKQAGAQCISGEIMFQAQALKQIELCYGVTL